MKKATGLEVIYAFLLEPTLYDAIILALTWGIGHFFTKDIVTGILCMISGFAFGSVYLLANRDIGKTFTIVLVMFVL